MEQRIEGKKAGSVVVKERGNVIGHKSKHGGSGKIAKHIVDGDLPEIGFRSGRTVELARFEFCRFKIDLRVHVPEGIEKQAAHGAAEEFVLEFVRREEDALSKKEYEPKVSTESREILAKCVRRYIAVEYGLTLKRGANTRESEQVDILEGMPISDNADLFEEFEMLSDEMAEKIDKQHHRIKGTEKDTGL